MVKALLIVVLLIGALSFALVVATATPNDVEEYKKYIEWKKREKKRTGED